MSEETKPCPSCGKEIKAKAKKCRFCGIFFDDRSDETLKNLIPYKNLAALIGYYIGVFSFIPLLGLLLAPLAIIGGIIGQVYCIQRPEAKGAWHARIAIILGLVSIICHVLVYYSLRR